MRNGTNSSMPEYSLVVLNGPLAHRRISFLQSTCRIGRSRDCHLRFSHTGVSREHCEIRIEPDGVTIEDLASKHGTFVNGARVEGQERIKAGDVLKIGHVEFQISDQPPPPSDGLFVGEGQQIDPTTVALCALNGPLRGASWILSGNTCLVGRAAMCHVCIEETSISRRHCVIRIRQNRILLRDLENTHGCFIDDEKVDEEAELKIGDRIRFGRVFFQLVTTDKLELLKKSLANGSHNGNGQPATDAFDEQADEVTLEFEDAENETVSLPFESEEVRMELQQDALVAEVQFPDVSDKDAIRAMKEQVIAALVHANFALVIDCRKVQSEGSTDFFRMLVDFRLLLEPNDIPLRLCGLNKSFQKTLESSSFHRLVPTFEDRDEAVNPQKKNKKRKKRRSKQQMLLAIDAERKAELKKAVQKQKDFLNHNIDKG